MPYYTYGAKMSSTQSMQYFISLFEQCNALKLNESNLDEQARMFFLHEFRVSYVKIFHLIIRILRIFNN